MYAQSSSTHMLWRTAFTRIHTNTSSKQATSPACFVCAYTLHITKSQIYAFRHIDTQTRSYIYIYMTVTLAVVDDAGHRIFIYSFASKIHLQGSHVGMKLFICSGANLQTCMHACPKHNKKTGSDRCTGCALYSYRIYRITRCICRYMT